MTNSEWNASCLIYIMRQMAEGDEARAGNIKENLILDSSLIQGGYSLGSKGASNRNIDME